MSKIFYVSDYHFYHEIALKRSRQDEFMNIEEMNEEIIKRHNLKVDDNDDVYILGDVIVCEEEELKEKLDQTVGRLKGSLHLILGNHDYKFRYKDIFLQYFESVQESVLIKDKQTWVQLYHYPVLYWYRKNKGAYHVFGHMHDECYSDEFNIIKNQEKALNACIEINRFSPCTLEELIINNKFFYSR